ncbi:hypothetical protein ACHAPU_001420 [Fusarium lateritium]
MDPVVDWEGDMVMTDAPPISPQRDHAKITQENSNKMAQENSFAPQAIYSSTRNGNGQTGAVRGPIPDVRRRLAMAVGPNRPEAQIDTRQQPGNRWPPREMENVSLSSQNDGRCTNQTPGRSIPENQTGDRNAEMIKKQRDK